MKSKYEQKLSVAGQEADDLQNKLKLYEETF